MLRRSLFSIIIFFFIISNSQANVYLGVSGNLTDIDVADATRMTGYGFDVGVDMMPGLILFLKTTSSKVTKDSGAKEFSHLMVFGVVEYNYQVSRLPLFVSISVGTGYNKTKVDYDFAIPEHYSDKGVGYGFWGGIRYHLTQYVSPYVNFGYHKALYKSAFNNQNNSGTQLNIGFTFTIWGENNSLYSEY